MELIVGNFIPMNRMYCSEWEPHSNDRWWKPQSSHAWFANKTTTVTAGRRRLGAWML